MADFWGWVQSLDRMRSVDGAPSGDKIMVPSSICPAEIIRDNWPEVLLSMKAKQDEYERRLEALTKSMEEMQAKMLEIERRAWLLESAPRAAPVLAYYGHPDYYGQRA
jgi:hypothetical protein